MSAPRIPVVLVSSAPGAPTGVSRIATDLASLLWQARDVLHIDLLHLGAVTWGPLPLTGVPIRVGVPWPCWVHNDQVSWGRPALDAAIARMWPEDQPGVIFAVQDPMRSYELLAPIPQRQAQWATWGYFSIDGTNKNGVLGGPAGDAIRFFDRVVGYGPYGSGVMGRMRATPVPAIPHGYNPAIWNTAFTPEEVAAARLLINPTGYDQQVIGCVASNQPRKDLAVFLETVSCFGSGVRGWLHVDHEVADAWSVPELAAIHRLNWTRLTVTTQLTDRQLAACYAQCAVTIAPGRGEGFGYPILESLACGTPCVHVDHAEGASILPPSWRVAPVGFVTEGPYAIDRPLLDATDVAMVVGRIFDRDSREAREDLTRYEWATVWPQWLDWWRDGLLHSFISTFERTSAHG